MQTQTSRQSTKEIVLQFFEETWVKGNLAAVDQMVSQDFQVHYPILPASLDAEGFKAWVMDTHTGFPDLQITVTDVICEADKAVLAWQARATHTGELKLLNLPPTRRSIAFSGIVIYRVVAGKVVEERGEEDALGLLRQLGLIP